MPRKGKRSNGLGVHRKGKRYKKIPKSRIIDEVNYNDNISSIEEVELIENIEDEEETSNIILDVNNNTSNDTAVDTAINTQAENDDVMAENRRDRRSQMSFFRYQKAKSQRWAIFHLFMSKYKGMDAPDGDYLKYWTGRNRIIARIRRNLGMKSNNSYKFQKCFEIIMECIRTETDFHPGRLDLRGGNREMTIRMESPEAQIIADGLESGLSIKNTWRNVNLHREENNEELISESCVSYALRKMRPKLVKIKKRKQGSVDPNSPWSKARYEWTTQLLVRFGKLDQDSLDEVRKGEDRFNRDLIGALAIDQVVWWDETHRKCLIGGASGTKPYQMLIPRNRDGKIDIEHGEYSKDLKTQLNVKYEKECRLGLGCAMVTPKADDGTHLPSVGRRCFPFNYTSKVLIGFDNFDKMVKTEISRVKI